MQHAPTPPPPSRAIPPPQPFHTAPYTPWAPWTLPRVLSSLQRCTLLAAPTRDSALLPPQIPGAKANDAGIDKKAAAQVSACRLRECV